MLSMGGSFLFKMALVEFLKIIFLAQHFDPFLAVCNSQVVCARVLKIISLINQVIVHASAKS
jgi:hypothetical protein